MSFGTSSGPPATAKQIAYLESLLRKAGHADWPDARRAYGLTAKQGRGKFTKAEASALIDQLTGTEPDEAPPGPDRAPADEAEAAGGPLSQFPEERLAAELMRRGWRVSPPG